MEKKMQFQRHLDYRGGYLPEQVAMQELIHISFMMVGDQGLM